MKYTIKTHKKDNKNIKKVEFKKKTLKPVKHHDVLCSFDLDFKLLLIIEAVSPCDEHVLVLFVCLL